VVLGSPGPAQEPTNLKPLIDKVLKAHGGEAQLRQLTAFTEKTKTRRSGSESTSEVFVQLPERLRQVSSAVGAVGPRKTISVYNGDQSWTKTTPGRSETVAKKLTKMDVAAWQASLKFRGPRRLLRLTDPASELAWLGEVMVGDRTAVGIQLTFKIGPGEKWFLDKETGSERAKVVRLTRAHEENLFFDKETGLLTKTEHTAVNVNGTKSLIETLYSDYKETDGIMIARKATVKTSGQVTEESEVVEFKVVDKLDDSLFQKP
jgi:hypothetical protein